MQGLWYQMEQMRDWVVLTQYLQWVLVESNNHLGIPHNWLSKINKIKWWWVLEELNHFKTSITQNHSIEAYLQRNWKNLMESRVIARIKKRSYFLLVLKNTMIMTATLIFNIQIMQMVVLFMQQGVIVWKVKIIVFHKL